MIRNITEGEGYWDLEEETNGSQCVACEGSETKAVDD
jgi:hypothetical protein